MYKILHRLGFGLGLVLAGQVAAADVEQLTKVCFSSSPIYAVPACEQLMESNDVDHKVHFHLAKLYQKQNQLEKAKTTLERALLIFDQQGEAGVVHKTALVKSDVDEEIWLQSQTRVVDKSAEHRVRCLKFSKILPQKALSSCDIVLAANPDDQEAAEHKKIAQQKLATPKPEKQVLVASRDASSAAAKSVKQSNKKSTSKNTVSQDTVSKDTVSKKKKATPPPAKPVVAVVKKTPPAKQKAKPETVVSSISTDTVPQSQSDQVLIDPKVIADIKNELSGLYALLKEEQARNAAAPKQSFNYQERGKRYALVIGNANYSSAIGKLKNSVNDAVDIGKKLKKLNFDVQTLTDGNLQQMESGVEKLAQKIKQDDTVLFYYAGHGVAIQGENYLLPTKMGIKDAVDVKYKSLNLSYVLDKLDRGSNGVTMVVLDACRNNPFPVSRGVARAGLVQASGPVGTIIAYSTAPGDVAQDGTGRNGLYTKHLLNEMSKPNIKLEDVFKKVRVAVEGDTQGSQVPWENSSLKGDFYFTYN